jgi:predicted adenylyl cyclase CyaB
VLQGRLKLREFGDGTAELIYYERPDKAGPKTSKYTRAQISDVASTREVLELVLGTKAVVAKQREVFLAGTTRIHLDEVDGLGTFVELEVVLTEDETDSDGERIASVLMEQLDVRQEEPH